MESTNDKPVASIDLCDPRHCDISFLVEGKLVRFNRFLLEFHSPVFAAIFSDRWSEDKDPSEPIELERKYCDISALFKVLTPYGFRSICFGNVRRLLELADFYQIGVVVSHCERFLLENLSEDHFLCLCELAVTFNLHGLLKLVNQPMIFRSYDGSPDDPRAGYLQLLAVCAKAKPELHAVFAFAEERIVEFIISYTFQALDLLITGYECGSKAVVDASLPLAAEHAPPAKLQAAKTKLSDDLHCELLRQHHACVQRKQSTSKARSKPIDCFVLARK